MVKNYLVLCVELQQEAKKKKKKSLIDILPHVILTTTLGIRHKLQEPITGWESKSQRG